MIRRFLALGLMLTLVSCVLGERDDGDQISYRGPIEIGIALGELLPGTDIGYLGRTENGAEVSIGAQRALKKIGDSLNWSGSPADGVWVDLKLRVVVVTEDRLHVAGIAEIVVTDPAPESAPVGVSAPIRYKLPVAYNVGKNQTVPGSVVTYLGQTEEGAFLGNVEGYAYRQPGDSIVWSGKLRDGVWIELNLRTAVIADVALNVIGTAELSIVP